MPKALTIILILLCNLTFSQEYIIEDAKKNTTEFLQALKILDMPEGKELITNLIFESERSFPIISDSKIIFERLFDTDINTIKGYKALVEVQTLSKSSTPLTIRYLLISYLSKKENKWKIFEFRESIDTEREVLLATASLDKETKYLELQYKLRQLGYWQMMNGQLLDSKNSFLKAEEVAKSKADNKFSIPTYLILDSIVDFKNIENKN